MFFPERIVPDETSPGIVALHEQRYCFALEWCVGREVLDAGCGVGYGSALLAAVADRVLGVDISAEAVAYAVRRYGRPNLEFARMDVTRLQLPEANFDVACSFETIEHLDDPHAAVAEAARVLRPGGIYLASTPHVRSTTRRPANPFHRIELSRADFEQMLRAHFAHVQVYGQCRRQTRRHRLVQRVDVLGLRRRLDFLRPASRLLGTAPMAEVSAADIVISEDAVESATELVAVCTRPRQ